MDMIWLILLLVCVEFCLCKPITKQDQIKQRHGRINAAKSRIMYKTTIEQSIQMPRAMPSLEDQTRIKIEIALKRVNETRRDNDPKALYTPGKLNPKGKVVTAGIADVFFFFELFDGNLKHVSKEYFWMLPQVASMYSGERDIRIHILSTSESILEKASSMGYYSHDISFQLARYAQLRLNIRRTEDSDVVMMQVLRWKAYDDIVKEWNTVTLESTIQRIIVLEDDTLLTVNAANLYEAAAKAAEFKSAPPEVVNLLGSAALFSPGGLTAFSAFIDGWYRRPNAEIKPKKGDTASTESVDSVLLRHFIGESPLRVAWFNGSEATDMTQALGCSPLENYRWQKNIQFESSSNMGVAIKGRDGRGMRAAHHGPLVVKEAGQKHPYCSLNFKEKVDKSLMYAFGRALQILRQGEEARSPSAQDTLSGDLLLSPSYSKEIYYVHSNNTRYFLPTLESFKVLSHSVEDIIHNVPISIIAAFGPDESAVYPWRNGDAVKFGKRAVYYVANNVLRPLANMDVMARLQISNDDVKQFPDYIGTVFLTLPIGETIAA